MTAEEHVSEELPLLLGGELGRDDLQSVVEHLRGCRTCREELVEASAAHASLAAVRRVLSAVGESTARFDLEGEAAMTMSPPPLTVPAGTARSARGRGGRGRGAPRRLLAAAVAAVVLLGVGGAATWRVRQDRSGSGPTVAAVQQAVLTPVVSAGGQTAAPGAAGVVRMSGPSERVVMTIRVTGLPPLSRGHFYYAWLLDPTTSKMLPVGVVGTGRTATFEIGRDLVARYSAVDISVQDDDGNPVHSPVSVLRATYAT